MSERLSRLSEQQGSADALAARAAHLLRAGQHVPGDDSREAGRRQRFRAALAARAAAPRGALVLRPALALALLLLLGSAALAGALLWRGGQRTPGAAPAITAPAAAPPAGPM